MRKRYLLILPIVLIVCSQVYAAQTEKDPVVATIGEKKITISDFNRIIGYYPPEKQKLFQENVEYKVNLLKRIAEGMVFSEMARKEGFDKDPAIKERADILVNDFLALEYAKEKVGKDVNVEEKDIKQYYEMHKNEFQVPEMIRARHILVKFDNNASDGERKKAREKAEGLLKRIKDGEDFAKIASESSDDPGSKGKGGDLGFFTKGKMVPEFEKAAFSLKPGEVSQIVESPYGFHIIRVEEKKDNDFEPYEAVKEKIREKLAVDIRKAKYSEFVDRAFKNAGVQLHPELLSTGK